MEDEPTGTADEKLLSQAKRHRKLAEAAWGKQREREKDDLRFQVPEEQWTEGMKAARRGGIDGGVVVPARPMLSISRLAQPIQMVVNQERAAHLGVSIQPLSADAETETAAVLEGIYRRIERDSQAHIARSWAFARAAKCGMGAYRVNTAYEDYSEDPMDQCITIERILHQEAVYFDPSASKPDFSDGNFAFVVQWMAVSDFKKQFPDAETTGDSAQDWASMLAEEPDWVKGAGEDAAVLVVEYFWKVKTFEDVTSPADKKKTRKREKVTVKRALLTGWEVLEEGEWNGKFIPLIPVIGQELHPYDSERRWTGIIADAKDGQQMYNAAASNAVELGALEPKAPWVGYAEQFEGYEQEWQQSNTRNFPVLRHKLVMVGGSALPAPQRTQVDGGRLSVSMQLLQMADQAIQATTATYDPSLGRTSSREKSGKAIQALQQQGEEGNSHYMHNLADISMNLEARVILDLIPAIYDRPGRIARTLSDEDKADAVMLNAPFVRDPETRRPMPQPQGPPMGTMPPAGMGPGAMRPGMPPQGIGPGAMPPQGMMPPPPRPVVKHYDLRKGIYSVAISIGKTRQSALQEGAEEIGQMLQAMPNLGPIILPTYLKFRDFPGAKELGEMLTKVRDKQFPGLGDDGEDGQPTVQQAQAEVAQLKQQLEMLGAQMQAAVKAIETEQVKTNATLQKAQMETQAGLQKAQLDNDAKIQVAKVKAESDQNLAQMKALLEQILQAQKIAHDTVQGDEDRTHEATMKVADAALAPPDLNWKGANDTPAGTNEEV
jgi:hypothetical protein